MDTIPQLIERLERATGRDVHLDFAVAKALGMKPEWNQFCRNGHVRGGMDDDSEWVYENPTGSRKMVDAIRFTDTPAMRALAINRLNQVETA